MQKKYTQIVTLQLNDFPRKIEVENIIVQWEAIKIIKITIIKIKKIIL